MCGAANLFVHADTETEWHACWHCLGWVLQASVTDNLVQKKLVYVYLANYAEAHSDLALLAVNTLVRNTSDANPLVRGLALRTLCSFRLAELVEYIVPTLKSMMSDSSAYVRRATVVGAVKVFHADPNAFRGAELLQALFRLVQDPDPFVCANACTALDEILAGDGGVPVSQDFVVYIFNRLREFDDWSQARLIDICSRFRPDTDEVRFALLNILDSRLQSVNAAVVFAAVQMFLALAQHSSELFGSVLRRVKLPLLTVLSQGTPEMAYCCLEHIKLLAAREPSLFSEDASAFFCRAGESQFVRELKFAVLATIANADNGALIVSELSVQALDVDRATSKMALETLARIAQAQASAARAVVAAFLDIIDSQGGDLLDDTLALMQGLIRKYPDIAPLMLERFSSAFTRATSADARVSLLWFLGEHGEPLAEAPYILEQSVTEYEAETSVAVRLQLLTACMRLFFVRPGEMEPILVRLLNLATADASHADVHDRALLYFRLLEESVEKAQAVVCPRRLRVEVFAEHADSELRAALLREFNTLSVVYGAPADTFTVPRAPYTRGKGPSYAEFGAMERVFRGPMHAAAPADASEAGLAPRPADALAPEASVPPSPPPQAELQTGPVAAAPLDQNEYTRLWVSLGDGQTVEFGLARAVPIDQLESLFARANVVCIAMGETAPSVHKLFFYTSTGLSYVLLQLLVNNASRVCSATVKTASPHLHQFLDFVQQVVLTAASTA